jgi:hypothetical protein
MTVQILSRRSTILYDRPFPARLGAAELAVNLNVGDPGLFFANSTGSSLIKIGPTFVGSTAPNLSPIGYTSLSKGESWLDTASSQILKIYDGTAWQIGKAVASMGASFPASPANGQLHYVEGTGLYIYRTSVSTWTLV